MRDDMIVHATAGILGGALGTALLRRGVKASAALPLRLQPTHLRQDPGAFMVTRLEQYRGKPLSRTVRDVVGQGLHWGYGMTSGLVLGLVTSRRHVRTSASALFVGAALGVGVWAVGYAGWLPALKLAPPLTRQGGSHIAVSILCHVAFGIITVAPIFGIDRRRNRRFSRIRRSWHAFRS